MENGNDLYVDEKREARTHRQLSRRRRSISMPDVIFTVVLLLICLTIWSREIWPVLPKFKHDCSKKHTIEERAAKILKETPLIGQMPAMIAQVQ